MIYAKLMVYADRPRKKKLPVGESSIHLPFLITHAESNAFLLLLRELELPVYAFTISQSILHYSGSIVKHYATAADEKLVTPILIPTGYHGSEIVLIRDSVQKNDHEMNLMRGVRVVGALLHSKEHPQGKLTRAVAQGWVSLLKGEPIQLPVTMVAQPERIAGALWKLRSEINVLHYGRSWERFGSKEAYRRIRSSLSIKEKEHGTETKNSGGDSETTPLYPGVGKRRSLSPDHSQGNDQAQMAAAN